MHVNTDEFGNVLRVDDRDDVLTLLIHFGYLTYDEESGCICIPNEEIRMEFAKSIHKVKLPETIKRVKDCDKLIRDVAAMDEEAVAAQLEYIHDTETDPFRYNGEQALRSVIKLAFFCCRDYFIRMEEPPCGRGYADIIYLPERDAGVPALVIELKWREDANAAIRQIKKAPL